MEDHCFQGLRPQDRRMLFSCSPWTGLLRTSYLKLGNLCQGWLSCQEGRQVWRSYRLPCWSGLKLDRPLNKTQALWTDLRPSCSGWGSSVHFSKGEDESQNQTFLFCLAAVTLWGFGQMRQCEVKGKCQVPTPRSVPWESHHCFSF